MRTKPLSIAITAAVFIAVFLMALIPIRLDDFFLYLSFGRRLFTLGTFGPTDPYLFTIENFKWDLWLEYLSYVYFYSVYSLGGYEAVIVMRALIAATLAALIWRACQRSALSPLVSVVIVGASFVATAQRCFRDRSSIFTDLFTTFLLLLLTDPRFTRRENRWNLALPLLFLLWVQFHPAYVFGWAILFFFFVLNWWKWDWASRRYWFFLSAACVFITAINPEGVHAILWPVRMLNGPDWGVFSQINEWQSPLTADFFPLIYKIYFVGFIAVSAILITAGSFRSRNWFPFAAALFVAGLGVSSSRFTGLASITLGVLLASALGQLDYSWLRSQSRAAFALALAIALGTIASTFAMDHRGIPFLISGKPLSPAVPTEAVEFFRRLPPGNTFNDWDLGGFLIWSLDERQKFAAHGFVTDPDLVMRKIYRFSYSREDWEQIVLKGNVEYFFIRRQTYEESRAASWIQELDTNWNRIYADNAAVIYRRIR